MSPNYAQYDDCQYHQDSIGCCLNSKIGKFCWQADIQAPTLNVSWGGHTSDHSHHPGKTSFNVSEHDILKKKSLIELPKSSVYRQRFGPGG